MATPSIQWQLPGPSGHVGYVDYLPPNAVDTFSKFAATYNISTLQAQDVFIQAEKHQAHNGKGLDVNARACLGMMLLIARYETQKLPTGKTELSTSEWVWLQNVALRYGLSTDQTIKLAYEAASIKSLYEDIRFAVQSLINHALAVAQNAQAQKSNPPTPYAPAINIDPESAIGIPNLSVSGYANAPSYSTDVPGPLNAEDLTMGQERRLVLRPTNRMANLQIV